MLCLRWHWQERVATIAAVIDVSAIATAFAAAYEHGIKRPKLRLDEFQFSRAPDTGPAIDSRRISQSGIGRPRELEFVKAQFRPLDPMLVRGCKCRGNGGNIDDGRDGRDTFLASAIAGKAWPTGTPFARTRALDAIASLQRNAGRAGGASAIASKASADNPASVADEITAAATLRADCGGHVDVTNQRPHRAPCLGQTFRDISATSNVSALRNSLPARATSCWRTAQRRLFKAALDA